MARIDEIVGPEVVSDPAQNPEPGDGAVTAEAAASR